MCGIYFVKNTGNVDISNNFYKIKNRGPDFSILHKINDYYLGFHRLSINGLNTKSNQPFIKNNVYLICNGEIYNFKLLYNELNIKPTTDSDCEIIIDLYLKFYDNKDKEQVLDFICKKLDGVFAFIIYDANIEKIYAARDPFGVRPMFYNNSSNLEITDFCSELKGLINLGNNNSIRQFPPGHFLVDNKIIKYHSFGNNYFDIIPFTQINEEYVFYCRLVKNTLITAVKKRLISDRPIACLLSGGLDSSLITSIVSNILNKQIETFSIGLPGATDLGYAKKVSEFVGTKHTEIIVKEEDFLNEIPETIKRIESYDTTTVRASVGNYLVAKYISEISDAKVIFNGDGADELMGGYLYFKKAPSNLEFDKEIHKLLGNIHYFDVLRSDRSVSSCGLEPRTPFLDKTFVNAYLSIPVKYRNSSEQEKKLLRDAFKGYLPEEVLYRQKEAFSDGVSAENKSWYSIIQEHIKTNNLVNETEFYKVNEKDLNSIKNKIPDTQEKMYYRKIFNELYPNSDNIIPYFWMPNWSNTNDPSARTL